MKKIILFDGDCAFCNSSIHFVIDHDPNKKFFYASIQSNEGSKLLKNFNINNPDLKTFYYIASNKLFLRSTGALKVLKELSTKWKFLSIFLYIPSSFRDLFYRLISKYRHRLSSNKNCRIIPLDYRNQFIDNSFKK